MLALFFMSSSCVSLWVPCRMEEGQSLEKETQPVQHSLKLFLRASSVIGCLCMTIFLDSATAAALLHPVDAVGANVKCVWTHEKSVLWGSLL